MFSEILTQMLWQEPDKTLLQEVMGLVQSNSRGSSRWSSVSFAQCQRDVNHNVMNNNKYEGVMHVGMSPKRACQQETRVY